jgi:hypothetical protein
MNASDFGWAMGLNIEYSIRYRQGRAAPTLAQVSKMEHAAGLAAVKYLMGVPGFPPPVHPEAPDGKVGPGQFERQWESGGRTKLTAIRGMRKEVAAPVLPFKRLLPY